LHFTALTDTDRKLQKPMHTNGSLLHEPPTPWRSTIYILHFKNNTAASTHTPET